MQSEIMNPATPNTFQSAIANVVNMFAAPAGDSFREHAATIAKAEQIGLGIENPDPVVTKATMAIYTEMRRDDALGAYLSMKKSAALSTAPKFIAASDDAAHVEHRDFIDHTVKRMRGSFKSKLKSMLTAVDYGFSLTNRVVTIIDDGPFKGKIGLRFLKTKPPTAIKFETDDFQNIVDKGIIYATPDGGTEPLPANAFIHYAYDQEFENPYGYSDCQRCFPKFNAKRYTERGLTIYLERFAGGVLDITHKAGEGTAEDHALMDKLIKNIQFRSGVKHSDIWTVAITEPSGRGADVFERAIKMFNIGMARAVLVPDLLGFSQTPMGSQALGKTHFDVFLWVLQELQHDMSETIAGEQLIKPLIDLNYPNVDVYPEMVFEPLSDAKRFELAEKLFMAIDKGVFTDQVPDDIENFVRELFRMEAKKETDERTAGGSAPADKEPKPKPGIDDDDPGRDPNKKEIPGESKDDTKEFATAADSARARVRAGLKPARILRKLNTYERKVDFQSIADETNTATDNMVASWSEMFRVQNRKIKAWVVIKNIIPDRDVVAVDGLKLPRMMDMKKTLARYLLSGMYFGALNAQNEVVRAAGGELKFQSSRGPEHDFIVTAPALDQHEFAVDLTTLPLDAIEQFFIDKGLVVSAAIKVSAREIKRQAFFITGVQSEKILAESKQVIYTGIRRGDLQFTMNGLDELFNGYLQTGQLTDGVLGQAYRIETIARTNFNTAFNEGRKRKFDDPDVRDWIVAMQWYAVLDSGTTPYCSALEGKKFTVEQFNAIGYPPAHYLCRSLGVPIVKGEQYTLDSIPAGVDRGKGFGDHRFAVDVCGCWIHDIPAEMLLVA